MIRVLGLSLYGSQAASTRYRLMQYGPGLRQNGIELEVRALLGNDYIRRTFAGESYPRLKLIIDYLKRGDLLLRQQSYDMAILHVELFPLLPGLIESRLLQIPYIYDFDDAFFLKYREQRFKRFHFLLKDKFSPILSRASAVTAGNQYLFEYAKHFNADTFWMPTVVDTSRYTNIPNDSDNVFTVGWIGSPSTTKYLSLLVEPLADLGKEMPIRFVVIGGQCPPIEGVDVVQLPWSENSEVEMINRFDVGVMPLFDDEWSRGKCALKLLQYMACELPVVASSVGANLEVVSTGCGFLASDHESWRDSLRRLRDDLPLRRSMGAVGRRRVEDKFSLCKTLPAMVNAIKLSLAKR